MSMYLFQGTYTAEGVKGLLKDGGTGRNDAISKLAASLGGKLESLHYSATAPAYFCMVTLPERGSAAAFSATIVASGAVTVDRVSELLTPAQMDASTKMTASYRAPGK